jgi:lysophospholipase
VSATTLGSERVPAARRALSNSPSGGYAPQKVSCPTGSLIRNARNISDGEQDFIEKRHEVTDAALKDFLGRANMTNFDVDSFISSYSPKIALAFSGGGYRAMLSGAGAVKAMDSRTPGTTGSGQIGGLLQSATYMAGLSGGSWLLGSVIVNNFTTIGALQESGNLWDLEHNILVPESLTYFSDIIDEVRSKEKAGFEVTLTDYWGRALSRQFLNWTNGGPGVTFSSIALTDGYKNADIPFPIVVADERQPGQKIISQNATIFEFNPLEFGTFDPTVFSFTPLEYLGTNMTQGAPAADDVCIRGFDNAG